MTCTLGGAISGYCAIGRPMRAIVPISTMRMDRTDAKIGRSMKKWVNRFMAAPQTARFEFSVVNELAMAVMAKPAFALESKPLALRTERLERLVNVTPMASELALLAPT